MSQTPGEVEELRERCQLLETELQMMKDSRAAAVSQEQTSRVECNKLRTQLADYKDYWPHCHKHSSEPLPDARKGHCPQCLVDYGREILAERDRLRKALELVISAATCEHCGKPAACVGRYEDESGPIQFACDECCGHGNEDGWCKRLEALKGQP